MKKKLLVFCTIMVVFLLAGCSSMDELGEKLTTTVQEEPDLIVYSDIITDALNAATTPYVKETSSSEMDYRIYLDGSLLSDSGFYGKDCNTLKEMLNCCQSVFPFATGYYTTNWEKTYTVDPSTNQEIVTGSHCYKKVDSFFAKAVLGGSGGAIPASEAIGEIVKTVNDSSVTVFITNLAMTSKDEPYLVLESLNPIVHDENMTIGLIAVKADYEGEINDLPIKVDYRGRLATVSDSKFGREAKYGIQTNETVRRPIYLVFMGEKNAVFSAMDNLLVRFESNKYLSEPEQTQSIYYYKYEYKGNVDPNLYQSGVQTVSTAFSGKIVSYADDECNLDYVFKDIPQTESVKAMMKAMPYLKIFNGILYSGDLETETDNVEFSFTMPYIIQTSTAAPKSKSLQFSGRTIDMSALSKTLITNALKLKLSSLQKEKGSHSGEYTVLGWESSDTRGLKSDSSKVMYDNLTELIKTNATLDITKLEKDVPTLFRVQFYVDSTADLTSEYFAQFYDCSWLKDWQMDVTALEKNWESEENSPDEALKTPFISEIFGENGLLSVALQVAGNELKTGYEQYCPSAVFGFIVRDQALTYNSEKDWSPDEDFGWAFSRNEVAEINKKNR